MSEAESSAYKPIVAHDREENYRQFEAVHGFDIRGELTMVRSTVSDKRDLRDQQALGEALLSRPDSVTILEFADLLGELNGKA